MLYFAWLWPLWSHITNPNGKNQLILGEEQFLGLQKKAGVCLVLNCALATLAAWFTKLTV